MSEAMTKQLAQALKGYYRNEEFSDKVLHIIEMEDAAKLPTNLKASNSQDVEEVSISASDVDINLDEIVDSDAEVGQSEASHENTIEDQVLTENDEAPKKVFQDYSFFVSENISGDDIKKVESLVKDNGGSFSNLEEDAAFIISNYILPRKKQAADDSERTIQWLEDCIAGNEIKLPLMNVLYRPISVKSKPLAKLILTFGNCEENDKKLLEQIATRLGASCQDSIFCRQNNNNMIASTHFILCSEDKSDAKPFNLASDYSIPCVSKQWLWKCSETMQKVDIKNYIIENINNINNTVNTSSDTNNDNAYSVFPVHSLILSFNSQYFKTLTSDSGMRETNYKNIVVKVNSGEGVYLELLIHSIYDQDVLKKLNILELLKVLELADRFLCDMLIEYGLEVLQNLAIETVEQCNEILEQVKIFKSLGSVSINQAYKSMQATCGLFLAKYFKSLECNPDKFDDFTLMSLEGLLLLLCSRYKVLWHENNVLYFIICWLDADEGRQTEYNIKKLLSKVRNEYTTLGYFMDVLSIDHPVLSKWQGFSKWHVNATFYHGFSEFERMMRGIECVSKNRSLKTSDIAAQSYVLKLQNVKSRQKKLFKYAMVENQKMVYQGYTLQPFVYFEPNDNGTYGLSLFLCCGDFFGPMRIANFYLTFNIAFGIFPGHITYEPYEVFENNISSNFIRNHFRRFEVNFNQFNQYQNNIGTVDEELFQKFITNGLNIFIIFGESEVNVNFWPTNLEALHDVRTYEINRKSTTTFGLNDKNYNNTGLYAEKIQLGKYF